VEHIDLYCERIGPEFWAEPINALTNASFVIAAGALWFTARRSDTISSSVWCLIFLSAAIGVGSFVFHTMATNSTRLLDVIPILLFQLVFLWLYAREVIGLGRLSSVLLLIGFFAAAILGRQFPQLLNGSLIYAPALVTVLALGVFHFSIVQVGRLDLLLVTALFAAALLFRTLDEVSCQAVATGSHFMWHVLNGLVVYLAARTIIRQRQYPHLQEVNA
jgi:hypothetical protein